MRVLRRGDTGPDVVEIRSILNVLGLLPSNGTSAPALFDTAVEQAVRGFQQRRGLVTDGIVGPATYRVLHGATYQLGVRPLSYLIAAPLHGDDVFALQDRLTELGYDAGRPDGVFGAQTELALRGFQRDMRLTADGICDAETVRTLKQLSSPRTRGGRPVLLREQEQVRRAGPWLRGKRILIDPGHGGTDAGVVVGGLREADVAWDLAQRLERRMKAAGMEALISRAKDTSPSEADRAEFANQVDADLLLSLHCDQNSSPDAQGIAGFHFGNRVGTSTIGELLAGFIQRELVARTGLRDCRTHGKTWEILRLTQCPAVRIEVGYLTNPADHRCLSDAAFRDTVVEGILIAVKRLYLLGEGDQPTGTFTFADVLAHELAKSEL